MGTAHRSTVILPRTQNRYPSLKFWTCFLTRPSLYCCATHLLFFLRSFLRFLLFCFLSFRYFEQERFLESRFSEIGSLSNFLKLMFKLQTRFCISFKIFKPKFGNKRNKRIFFKKTINVTCCFINKGSDFPYFLALWLFERGIVLYMRQFFLPV